MKTRHSTENKIANIRKRKNTNKIGKTLFFRFCSYVSKTFLCNSFDILLTLGVHAAMTPKDKKNINANIPDQDLILKENIKNIIKIIKNIGI